MRRRSASIPLAVSIAAAFPASAFALALTGNAEGAGPFRC
jgi:hypothetical protein